MKKNILFIVFIILINSITAFENTTIIDNPDKRIYEQVSQLGLDLSLYETEEEAKRYIDFLLKARKLPIANQKYEITIFDENEDWLVLLDKEKSNSQKGVIIDYLDGKTDYVLVINKGNGAIKAFISDFKE